MQEHWVQSRRVEAEVYTQLGWVSGVLHVIEGAMFFDALNRRSKSGAFLKLTSAKLPERPDPLPFFGIRREAALLIVPKAGEELLDEYRGAAQGTQSYRIQCYLEKGVVRGTLDLASGARVSDFLRNPPEFFVLRNCRGSFWPEQSADGTPNIKPVLAVNIQAVIGVDDAPPATRDEAGASPA